jgi:hypothetical protein
VPSGSAAATLAISCDTEAPIATRPGSTPSSRANPARDRATNASKSPGRFAPVRHRSTDSATAAATGAGGMPTLGVLRYPGGTANSAPKACMPPSQADRRNPVFFHGRSAVTSV